MRRVFLLLLFGPSLLPAEPQELSALHELYFDSSVQGSYRTVIDLEEFRWYFLQEFHARAGETPRPPFEEHRQATPIQRTRGYVPVAGETVVGFDSPYLWFGPLTLAGAYAAMERPLEQRPFSAAWEAPSRTRLSSGRAPPSRVGVGGAVGPLFISHTRTGSVRRTVSTIRLGDSGARPIRVDLLAGRTVVDPAEEEESWIFDEPPLLSRTGYHTGARLSLLDERWQTDLLFSSSLTTLDPPGHAAVGRLIAPPLGLSLALVTRGYRDGDFDLLRPGAAVALARKPPARRGHTIDWTLRAARSGSPGASRESTMEGEGSVRWNWRRRSATGNTRRLGAEATLGGERNTAGGPEEEAAVDLFAAFDRPLGARGFMEVRLRGGAALEERFRQLLSSGEIGLGYRRELVEVELTWESRAAANDASPVLHAPGAELLLYPGRERTIELGIRLTVDEPAPWFLLRRLSLQRGEALITLHGRYRPRINRAASK